MTSARNWNAQVIAEFRLHDGRVRAPYDDPPPMVLLHTIGARSGEEHVVPMRGLPDGTSIHVFATAHGSDQDPDWYHNLVAHPEITIERGREKVPVRATVLRGQERETMLSRWIDRVPMVADVIVKTDRNIPVIRLDPR